MPLTHQQSISNYAIRDLYEQFHYCLSATTNRDVIFNYQYIGMYRFYEIIDELLHVINEYMLKPAY